jgi:hypothetical protein
MVRFLSHLDFRPVMLAFFFASITLRVRCRTRASSGTSAFMARFPFFARLIRKFNDSPFISEFVSSYSLVPFLIASITLLPILVLMTGHLSLFFRLYPLSQLSPLALLASPFSLSVSNRRVPIWDSKMSSFVIPFVPRKAVRHFATAVSGGEFSRKINGLLCH